MPDFREQSPSKIAAGFGGTLNLVLSAIYILLVVLMTALPCHFYLLTSDADLQSQIGHPQNLKLWVGLGLVGVLVLAALVTIIPLRSGLKAFRNLEV
jgi:ABC-2 type transport system permease protein